LSRHDRRPRRHLSHQTRTGLRAGDEYSLVALVGFRAGFGRAAQRPDHTGVPEGDRHPLKVETINANDLQSRITSAKRSAATEPLMPDALTPVCV
jgi:hypothetical protein